MMRASREAGRARGEHVLQALLATRISPRTMRAYDTQPTGRDGDDDAARCPGPSTNTSAITSTKNGKATTMSTRRITTRVDEAAVVARRGSRAPCRCRTGRARRGTPISRSMRPRVDQARKHVAAELVGAEPVRAARVRVGVQEILGVRVVAGDQRRQHAPAPTIEPEHDRRAGHERPACGTSGCGTRGASRSPAVGRARGAATPPSVVPHARVEQRVGDVDQRR